MGGQPLVVPDSAPVAGDPRQGSPRQTDLRGRTLKVCRSSGRFTISTLRRSQVLAQVTSFLRVAPVSPGQLDSGEGPPQVPQQWPGGVAVLHRGGGDQHRQQQAEGIDGKVAFRAVDLLPGVIAAAGYGRSSPSPSPTGNR